MEKKFLKYLLAGAITLIFSYMLAETVAKQIGRQKIEEVKEKMPAFLNLAYKDIDLNLFTRSLAIEDVNCTLFSNDNLRVPIERIEITRMDFKNEPPSFLEASIKGMRIPAVLLNLITLGKGIYFKKEIPLSLKIKYEYPNQGKCIILREIGIKSKDKMALRLSGTFCNMPVKRNNFYQIFFAYSLVTIKNLTLELAVNDIQYLKNIVCLGIWKSKLKNMLELLDDKVTRSKHKRVLKNLREIKRFLSNPNKILVKEIPGATVTLIKLLNPENPGQALSYFNVKAVTSSLPAT